eukprot:m.150068 g.150068  ORF g.150068 m.150068 type:complete len:87 (+) comp38542_c0_seq22:301-561(+)
MQKFKCIRQDVLQTCADMCREDVLRHSQMLLKLMKLHPSALDEHALETVKELSQPDMTPEMCDVLVNEALPLILTCPSAIVQYYSN